MGWCRHPKTTAERRANQEGYCRPRRRPHRLPNAWDDLIPCRQRSWKEHRKQQWKGD